MIKKTRCGRFVLGISKERIGSVNSCLEIYLLGPPRNEADDTLQLLKVIRLGCNLPLGLLPLGVERGVAFMRDALGVRGRDAASAPQPQSANQVRLLLLRPFGCLFMFNLDMR